jgi:nucleotide-binding universal stress UspA family protein
MLMEDIKRILVVSRSTNDCEKAIHYGISLARTYGAQLSILHIEYEHLMQWTSFGVIKLSDVEKEYRAMMKKARKEIDEMIRKEEAQGLKIKETMKSGEPIHEIMTVVEKDKINLIIMAAHDEGRLEHVIYGRFNHEIVRRLPCSVFLVKGE